MEKRETAGGEAKKWEDEYGEPMRGEENFGVGRMAEFGEDEREVGEENQSGVRKKRRREGMRKQDEFSRGGTTQRE